VTDAALRTRSTPQAADAPAATAALRALDRLIAAYGPDELLATPPAPAAADGLVAVIRLLAAEARRAAPGRAERMVVALRAAWPTLPAVQHLPPGDGRERLLARLITLAIAEFYRPTLGAGETADDAVGVKDATPSPPG
jgi:hypothetical protein